MGQYLLLVGCYIACVKQSHIVTSKKQRYGTTATISRKVITVGSFERCRVEIYPINVNIRLVNMTSVGTLKLTLPKDAKVGVRY